jgi:hypothetical protein
MGKVWIASLAEEIKTKGREAAESYDRDQHRAGIIAAEGKVFFTALTMNLEQDLSEIRSQLQGSAVSCETSLVKDGPSQVRLIRSRFPWFDATLKHDDASITLEYAQGRGAAVAPNLRATTELRTVHYAFEVDGLDRLSVAEAFGDEQLRFEQAEGLAKHILELLFQL